MSGLRDFRDHHIDSTFEAAEAFVGAYEGQLQHLATIDVTNYVHPANGKWYQYIQLQLDDIHHNYNFVSGLSIRIWGGQGKSGTYKVEHCYSKTALKNAHKAVVKMRAKNGYEVKGFQDRYSVATLEGINQIVESRVRPVAFAALPLMEQNMNTKGHLQRLVDAKLRAERQEATGPIKMNNEHYKDNEHFGAWG